MTRILFSATQENFPHYTFSLESEETVSEESETESHEPEKAGGPEGAFELERVEHETGKAFGPEGATSEELEPEKNRFCQSRN